MFDDTASGTPCIWVKHQLGRAVWVYHSPYLFLREVDKHPQNPKVTHFPGFSQIVSDF